MTPEPRTVLVVDDEVDVQPLFKQRFRRQIRDGSVRFEFANSGSEARETLGEGDAEIVLILSDIRMDGMDGFELLSEIRKKWPPMPVYLVTAFDAAAYREQADELGASGYLTKPVDFNKVKALIFDSEDAPL